MIFKIRYTKIKNLRGQLTALKPSDLNMAFKVLNGRGRKRWKRLLKTEIPASGSSPEATCREDRVPVGFTWSLLQMWQHLSPSRELPFSAATPRRLHKLGTGGSAVPLCLAKFPPSSSSTENSLRPSGPGSQRLMPPWDLGPNTSIKITTQGSRLTVQITGWISAIFNWFGSYKVHISFSL